MKMAQTSVFRGLTSVTLALTVLLSSMLSVAMPWNAKVNELLGISSDQITRSRDAADYIFLSDFDDPNDLLQAHIDLNTRIGAEGTVVLKGNAAVGGNLAVTLFGMRSEVTQFGGSMGGLASTKRAVSLTDALKANGFSVNPVMQAFYKGLKNTYPVGGAGNANSIDRAFPSYVNEVPAKEYTSAQQSSYAEYSDAAIIVLGRDASEGKDYYPGTKGVTVDPNGEDEFSQSATGNILSLSDDERDLIAHVKGQNFTKIIVLLNTGNALEIDELKHDEAIDSIVWMGIPGSLATYGVAQILSGSVLPSGHLTDTYAVNSANAPATVNYGAYAFTNANNIDPSPNNAERAKWYLVENESIYIGYKYYETRYYDAMMTQDDTWDYDSEVSYAFGYGVEGSTFSEEIVARSIDWTGATPSNVTVRVTNTGSVPAKHVVQLYVSVPYTDYDRANAIEKAAIQLIGYGKTGEASEADYTQTVLLPPGESEDVVVSFNAQDMMSYDMLRAHDGVTGAYILEAGDYYFATGNGAHEAVNAVLSAQDARFAELPHTGVCITESLTTEVVKTESNGVLIQNQLSDADLNQYNCGVIISQLTRDDWAGSWPTEIKTLTATPEMVKLLQNDTYDAAAELAVYTGPSEFVYGVDHDIDLFKLTGLDFNDPLYEQALEQVTLQEFANTYIAKLENIANLSFPKRVGTDSPLGLICTLGKYTKGTIFEIAEDNPAFGQETHVYAGPMMVAATYSHLLASEQGRLIGNDALWSGIHSWNAPGVNIHRSQYNARNYEYYSEDAMLTGYMAADMISAVQQYGLIVGMKHFAFNDQEANRDGVAVFISEQAARENELRGSEIAVRDGKVNCIMTAFNRVGLTHASASRGLNNGILRGEWGWNGYLITDSVKSPQYFRPTECLLAGNDMMLGGAANGAVWQYTEQELMGDIVVQAGLRDAFHRYLYQAANGTIVNGITPETKVSDAAPWWQTVLRAGSIVCGVLTVSFAVLWLVTAKRRQKTAE